MDRIRNFPEHLPRSPNGFVTCSFQVGRSVPSASRNVAPSSTWKKKRGIVVAHRDDGAGELFPHARNRESPGLGLRPWGSLMRIRRPRLRRPRREEGPCISVDASAAPASSYSQIA
jgi:hypothetical protein